MAVKIDYQAECALYLRLKKSGEKLTQAAYCTKRAKELGADVSLSYFKKVLKSARGKEPLAKGTRSGKEKGNPKSHPAIDAADQHESGPDDRRDYGALRLEFLDGPWGTLAAFAREKGIKPSSNWFREKTKGWHREKKLMLQKVHEETAKALVQECIDQRVRGVYEHVQVIVWKLLEASQKLADGIERWKTPKSPTTAYYGALFIKELHAALKDMAPFIQGMERMDEVNRIFGSLGKGELNVYEATIELMKIGVEIPKALQIMLTKGPGEERPPEEGELLTEEKILARRNEMMQRINQQRIEWVPARAQEVADLKGEMAGRDSFAKQKLMDEGGASRE